MADVFTVGCSPWLFRTARRLLQPFHVGVSSHLFQESPNLAWSTVLNEGPAARRQSQHHTRVVAGIFVGDGRVGKIISRLLAMLGSDRCNQNRQSIGSHERHRERE